MKDPLRWVVGVGPGQAVGIFSWATCVQEVEGDFDQGSICDP